MAHDVVSAIQTAAASGKVLHAVFPSLAGMLYFKSNAVGVERQSGRRLTATTQQLAVCPDAMLLFARTTLGCSKTNLENVLQTELN